MTYHVVSSVFFQFNGNLFSDFCSHTVEKIWQTSWGCWTYSNSWDVYIIKRVRSFWNPWRWDTSQIFFATANISLLDGQVTALAVHGNYMVRDALEVVVAGVKSSDDHRILLRSWWFSGLEWWKCDQGAWCNSNWNILRCKLARKTIQTMSGWNLQQHMYIYIYIA